MKKTPENKAIEMDRNSQGHNADSNIAHTLKPGEQEFSFPAEGITVVATSLEEAEAKKDHALRSRGPKIENKEAEADINNK